MDRNLINNTKLIYINKRKYAFDTHHLLLCEIDDVYENCITYIRDNLDIKSLYKEYGKDNVGKAYNEIQEYIDAGIFFTSEKLMYEFSREDSTGCFSFPPKHQCNLACKYCFADHGSNFAGNEKSFSETTLEKSFDFVVNKLYPDMNKYRIDFVSGGEPLLNFEIIKKACQIRNRYEQQTGKPIEIFLATNATLLTKEHLDFFNSNNINIGISLDGEQTANDKCRVYADGSGTYCTVINSLKMIINDESLSRKLKNIWGLSVIHSENMDVNSILEHHSKVGLKSVQMKIVRLDKQHSYSINDNNADELLENYNKLKDAVIKTIRNGDKQLLEMYLNDNDYFGKIILRLISRTPVIYRCAAGKTKVSICANGDIYPCDSFVGNEAFRLGNVTEEIYPEMMDKFSHYSIYNNSECQNCWIRHLCGGDCHHNSLLAGGSVDIPDPVICKINRHLAMLAMEIMIEIENNEDLSDYFNRAIKARQRTY